MTAIYKKISIIGLGLIGASIALATRRKKLAEVIVGYDSASKATGDLYELQLVDEIATSPEAAVAEADLVIMAVPVGEIAAVAKTVIPFMKFGSVLTDTGSTKSSVIRDVEPFLNDSINWLPSHPLAGTEHSGPRAGMPDLFDGRYWVILPLEVSEIVINQFESFIVGLGSIVERMTADYHDKILALTSHLPHLIAYTIVGTAVDLEQQLKNDVIRFSASGFRDFTRIAASDPIMWRDVFLNNKEAVLEMLQRFSEDLSYLQRAIRWQEGDKLEDLFSRTREIRRSIIDAGQD